MPPHRVSRVISTQQSLHLPQAYPIAGLAEQPRRYRDVSLAEPLLACFFPGEEGSQPHPAQDTRLRKETARVSKWQDTHPPTPSCPDVGRGSTVQAPGFLKECIERCPQVCYDAFLRWGRRRTHASTLLPKLPWDPSTEPPSPSPCADLPRVLRGGHRNKSTGLMLPW